MASPIAGTARFGSLSFRTLLGSEFDGTLSVFEVELSPGCLSGPAHVHHNEDAVSYVLGGELTFLVGDDITRVSAGECVALPRLVRHTFWNAGKEQARAVDVVTPGGLEHYYDELARVAADPDAFDLVVAMESRYGVIMDWDTIPELLARYDLRLAATSDAFDVTG